MSSPVCVPFEVFRMCCSLNLLLLSTVVTAIATVVTVYCCIYWAFSLAVVVAVAVYPSCVVDLDINFLLLLLLLTCFDMDCLRLYLSYFIKVVLVVVWSNCSKVLLVLLLLENVPTNFKTSLQSYTKGKFSYQLYFQSFQVTIKVEKRHLISFIFTFYSMHYTFKCQFPFTQKVSNLLRHEQKSIQFQKSAAKSYGINTSTLYQRRSTLSGFQY